MPFFAPLMLLGLTTAAAPMIIHLMRKRSARRIIWGAWQFLAESMRMRRRKLLLEEIILLVIRTAILVLAALAFARPYLPEMGFFGGAKGEKDVVIVLDASGSMNLPRKDGSTAFEAAIREIRELIDLAPRGVAFGLVKGGRDAQILTATPFSSKREILKLLEKVKIGDETMDVPRALEAAAAVLSGGNHLGKEILIFGDGQGYGWRPSDENAWRRVAKLLSGFNRRPPVVWRTLERPKSVKNAAIRAVVPSRRIIGTDRPLTFTVDVVNSGSEPFSPGELSMTVDGVRVASQPVGQVLSGLTRSIPFVYQFTNTGPHVVVTSLAAADDIATDNVVTNPVEVINELKVLLVNGRLGTVGFERPTAYLEAALRPALKDDKTPFLVRPVNVRPTELEATNVFKDVAVTVLCDVPSLSERAADNLARWTASGGGLLAVPGEKPAEAFYTNWTWKAHKVMPAVWTNFVRAAEGDRPLTVAGAALGGRMLFDEGAIVSNELKVLTRTGDGLTAAVVGDFFKGRVGMLAMPLDLSLSDLPARPNYVPYVHELVYSLSAVESVKELRDVRWSSNEGDVSPLTAAETEAVSLHIDLSLARLKEDALSAIVGRGFGVEIWRPLAIITFILLILEWFLSRWIDQARAGEGAPVPRSRLLQVLRVIAFLMLVWMLAHIVLVHDVQRKISRKVAVVVDISQSMHRSDCMIVPATNAAPAEAAATNAPVIAKVVTNLLSRLEVATNTAARLETLLGRKYDVEPFLFGGETTDFAEALEMVRTRIPSEELAGAVIVSDGRPTAGADVEAISRLFARQGAKISSVIVGSETNRSDVAIQDAWTPETLFLGDKVRIETLVRADQLKDEKVTVKLMLGDQELERREFKVTADEWTQEVRFTDEPKGKGTFSYKVVLETPKGDSEAANNVWPLDVSVSDDRTNVLIADRRSRWEFRYLRNLFYGRDKSVHLQYVLENPDRIDGEVSGKLGVADATREFGDAEAGALPKTREAWRKFDVMVFGDLSPEQLSDQVVADIRSCIEERGATVVFIAGDDYMPLGYVHSPLAELFPVTMTNAKGRVTAEWLQGGYAFAVSGAGQVHDIMSLSESDAENARIWGMGCEWTRRLDGLGLKPGATTLAYAGDSTVLKSPLLVIQHRGRGKVVFLASDETWRFRYRIGDTYHHRFWGNVMRWGSGVKLRDGTPNIRLGAERLHYLPGEPVRLRARLSDAQSLPLEGLKLIAKIKDPSGKVLERPLTSLAGGNGTYETTFDETAAEGAYEVTIESKEAQKALGEKWPKDLKTGFDIRRSFAPYEYAFLSSDRAILAAMAALTGGEVLTPDGVSDKLAESFGAGRSETTDHIEDPIWDHPLAFIFLAAALIVMWILRKRKGLA